MRFLTTHVLQKGILLISLFMHSLHGTEEVVLPVWATIEPQAYFVEAVGGDSVSVSVLVRPGQCVELYAPSPRDLVALSRASAYFRIGVPLESAITSQIEARSKGLKFFGPEYIGAADAHSHSGAHCELCGSETADPHTWLDPVQMIDYIDTIRDGLSEVLPAQADLFVANAEQLKDELRALHNDFEERFSNYTGRVFYINHPSLTHFAKRYGLEQRSIELAGSTPSAKRTAVLIKEARETGGIGAILTQPEFGRSSASVMANALEVPVLEVDILRRDYLNSMQDLALAVERSFAND